MASEIRLKLLQLVLNEPEIKRDDIRAHKSFEDEDDRALANLLYNCKKDEQLVADEGGHYTITAKGRAYLKEAGVELPAVGKKPRGRGEPVIPQPSPGRRDGKASPPHPDVRAASKVLGVSAEDLQHSLDKTKYHGNAATMPTPARLSARAIAEQLLDDSQAAPDRYVESVCDPAVLARFRAARDQARELVGSFNAAGEHPEGGDRG